MSLAQLKELYDSLAECNSRATEILQGIEETIRRRAAERIGPENMESLIAEIGLARKVMGRRFSVVETCELIGITRQGLAKAEAENRLPKPDMKPTTDGRFVKAGYTLDQICDIRERLGKKPKQLPRVVVLGILNQKGGAQKTTTTLNLAQFLVLKGYKVLVIDSDPQCSGTALQGLRPDVDFGLESTMTPFILQDDHIFEDENGEFPDDYEESMLADLRYAVQHTYWRNLDIIPSTSETMETDLIAASERERILATYNERTGKNVKSVSELMEEGLRPLKDSYDVILVDGTPSLSVSTVNIISACDEVLVPTPAHMIDFASTCAFSNMVQDMIGKVIKTIEEGGGRPDRKMPELSFLVTKFTNSVAAETMEQIIRISFGSRVLKNNIELSDAVREAGNDLHTVYEISPADKGYNKKLRAAVENYNNVFEEVLSRVICGQIAVTGSLFSEVSG